jgi:RND family efflux transporter MFP subunit
VLLTTEPIRVFAPRARSAASLLLGLLLAGGAGAQPRGPGLGKPTPLRVTTALVEGRMVERRIDTVGNLLAWEEAVARAPLDGTIVRLYADLGDAVRAGQPLADLDRREAEQAIAQLTATLAAARERLVRARTTADASRANVLAVRDSRQALAAELERARAAAEEKRRELERNQVLRAKDLIATRDVDQARIRSESADGLVLAAETALGQLGDELRAAEARLDADLAAVGTSEALVRQDEAAIELGRQRVTDTVVLAPLTGVVATRHVTAGEFVRDQTALFTVVATDPLKYSGIVAERAAREVRLGQEVRLTVEAFGDRSFPGEVTRVAPRVDGLTRTLALEARVLNGEGHLRPGVAARGTVLVRRDTGVPFVPAEALVRSTGGIKMFAVVGGRAEERLVKIGLHEAGWIEILNGATPGETVVTSGHAQLYDGATVTSVTLAPTARP